MTSQEEFQKALGNARAALIDVNSALDGLYVDEARAATLWLREALTDIEKAQAQREQEVKAIEADKLDFARRVNEHLSASVMMSDHEARKAKDIDADRLTLAREATAHLSSIIMQNEHLIAKLETKITVLEKEVAALKASTLSASM